MLTMQAVRDRMGTAAVVRETPVATRKRFSQKAGQIGKDIQRFKSYTARRIIDHLEAVRAKRLLDLLALFKRIHKTQSEHQLWEEGGHPQRIESELVPLIRKAGLDLSSRLGFEA